MNTKQVSVHHNQRIMHAWPQQAKEVATDALTGMVDRDALLQTNFYQAKDHAADVLTRILTRIDRLHD